MSNGKYELCHIYILRCKNDFPNVASKSEISLQDQRVTSLLSANIYIWKQGCGSNCGHYQVREKKTGEKKTGSESDQLRKKMDQDRSSKFIFFISQSQHIFILLLQMLSIDIERKVWFLFYIYGSDQITRIWIRNIICKLCNCPRQILLQMGSMLLLFTT